MKRASGDATSSTKNSQSTISGGNIVPAHRSGTILVVEDDPEVRDLLQLLLKDEGHNVVTAQDGAAALALAGEGAFQPDIILSDYNLPDGLNGVEITTKLREKLKRRVPIIILTGDISTDTLRKISAHDCVQLNKPVKVKEMTQVIQSLLAMPPSAPPTRITKRADMTNHLDGAPVIFVVDDDIHIREAMRSLLEGEGYAVKGYASCEEFLNDYQPGTNGCLLVDAYLPGMKGIELLQRLNAMGQSVPAIMITGSSDVPMAVEAMKAGASDFIEKPISASELVAGVTRALEQSRDASKRSAWQAEAAQKIAGLTKRQHQVMDLVVAGHPSKNIAADLGLSQRTVETHRAAIMHKTGSKSLPALARLALAASQKGAA